MDIRIIRLKNDRYTNEEQIDDARERMSVGETFLNSRASYSESKRQG